MAKHPIGTRVRVEGEDLVITGLLEDNPDRARGAAYILVAVDAADSSDTRALPQSEIDALIAAAPAESTADPQHQL